MRCAKISANSGAAVSFRTLTFRRSLLTDSSAYASCHHACALSSSVMQLVVSAAGAASHHHSSSPLQCSVRCFNLKEHEMERRRRRELEKAGIDPDDDTPWIAPEEEQRIAEEDERRKAEQEVLVAAMLEKRAAEDAEKKLKFKQFRAKQVAMSKQRKDSNAASKDHKVNSREVQEVEAEETGPDSSSSKQ